MWCNGRELRSAMRAARSVLRPNPLGYTTPCCRLTNGDVFATARMTDGHRAAAIQVRRAAQVPPEPFDEALPREVMRHLCQTASDWVDVKAANGRLWVRDGRDQEVGFDTGKALDVPSLERALGTHDGTGAVAELERIPVRNCLQGIDARRTEVLTMQISAAGLTVRHRHGDQETREATLTTTVANAGGKRIVFGLRGSHLADTMRTLKGRKVWVHVRALDLPVHCWTKDGERVTLATARL